MKKVSLIKTLTMVVALASASASYAQATRTWVSGVGDDVNPCSRTAPCKTWAGAISKTATNGEISALDPGGFGPVTINKGITINGDGTLASILNAGTNGIVVNIAQPTSATVYIRNVSINGAGTGFDGIRVLSGGTVVVENCWIYGQTSDGIEVNATAGIKLKVNNTTIENVAADCVRMSTTSGQVVAMINGSRMQNCSGNGIEGNANVRAGVRDTVITHGGTSGIVTTGNDSIFNLDDIQVSYFTNGLKSNNAGVASHIRVSDSIIAQNGTGIDTSGGGTIDSFQGNSLIGNTTPGSFSSTTIKQ
ncbi:MAG TPA: right-handed parallel beta-helix repeat-containing protein [Thermoanaerobaculia bacterium]|jgi:hypothetical protein